MNQHHCGMELEDGTKCDRPALHGGELHPQRADIQHKNPGATPNFVSLRDGVWVRIEGFKGITG